MSNKVLIHLINERLECFGEGNVHGAHPASMADMANFGKFLLATSAPV
jgi:hypothetical protein